MYEVYSHGELVTEFAKRKAALGFVREQCDYGHGNFQIKLPTGKWYDWSKGRNKPAPDNIPHPPWFIRPRPTDSGLAIIENGTNEGSHIAECEWHIAEFIVKTVNRAYPTKGE
jgi:hypothetical protein